MTESPEHRRRQFEAFHAEHFPAILSYALRRCPTRDDACDLASEVFLTAWRRFDDVPDGNEGRLWLFGAARRSLGNRVRGDQRRERLTAKLAQQVELLALPDHDDSRDETVRQALAMLSPDDRELLVLTAWDGLTPAEAATVLEISAPTARVRLHRAKERLRRRLNAVDGSPPSAKRRPEPHPLFPTAAPKDMT